MRIYLLTFGAIASIITTAAFADTTVTSKQYVDNRDALKVDIAQGVGTNNANVGKTLVVNSSGNLELGTPAATNYVEDSITDGVTNKAPSENAVHDALADKQDIIAGHPTGRYPNSVVTDTTTDGTIDKRVVLASNNGFRGDAGTFGSQLYPGRLVDFLTDQAENVGLTADDLKGGVVSAEILDAAFGVAFGYINDKQRQKTCAGWLDGTTVADATHTDANCVLWNLPN